MKRPGDDTVDEPTDASVDNAPTLGVRARFTESPATDLARQLNDMSASTPKIACLSPAATPNSDVKPSSPSTNGDDTTTNGDQKPFKGTHDPLANVKLGTPPPPPSASPTKPVSPTANAENIVKVDTDVKAEPVDQTDAKVSASASTTSTASSALKTAAGDVSMDVSTSAGIAESLSDDAALAEPTVAIIDCGAQYAKVIDRRVREARVKSVLVSYDVTAEELRRRGFKAIIISGGPASVYAPQSPAIDEAIFEMDVPILGICYGFQLILKHYGCTVAQATHRDDSIAQVIIDTECPIFAGMEKVESVLLTHGDVAMSVAADNTPRLRCVSRYADVATAVADVDRRIYGTQFHPEVDLTVNGHSIFANFLFAIADCQPSYSLENRAENCMRSIRSIVGDKRVLVMVSGGVDSTVCAALVQRALVPPNATVDTSASAGAPSTSMESAAPTTARTKTLSSEDDVNEPKTPATTVPTPKHTAFARASDTKILSNEYDAVNESTTTYATTNTSDVTESSETTSDDSMTDESDVEENMGEYFIPDDFPEASGELGRVIALYVDTGFMRHDETKDVVRSLNGIGIKPIVVHAATRFLYTRGRARRHVGTNVINADGERLIDVADPEHKRQLIGDIFMQVKDDVMSRLKLRPEECMLAQGTLRPDLIESASATVSASADTIKTHHNDSRLVRELRQLGHIVEPLSEFHKDEVRAIGRELGLPTTMVERHPFPGPGLAIRVLCSRPIGDQWTYTHTQRRLEAMFAMLSDVRVASSEPGREDVQALMQMIPDHMAMLVAHVRAAPLKAMLLPVRSVGVQGDKRTYGWVCAIAKAAPDELTAYEPYNWHIVHLLSRYILRAMPCINRVVVALTTVNDTDYGMCPTNTRLTEAAVNQLRDADAIVSHYLRTQHLTRHISQMPVVLLPVHMNIDEEEHTPCVQRAVVLRPFLTSDFMTGQAMVPSQQHAVTNEHLMTMAMLIVQRVVGVSAVFLDVTNKPPGTTEWE